ncbi:trehalose-binding protein [Sphaerisporangium melleum]|uniref:Trehalose-binding protein n=1 Tax=Sphaerisporangium melleum TaxID=321316 RepID=A0A917VGZ1_9ACTN|nr:YihY/virulence factor BrkB family protein [Sphaerisporangium melleum]GGK76807.1 trehalose-binding protein [Sphaerisporangium melleum]GII71777.1 trehalose-binding protein [Sphaerisporangium melleum]
MGDAWASVVRTIEAGKQWSRRRIERSRVRWLWLDHLIRTFHRYQSQRGDRLAGAVTYFAFLSFFPLLALAFSLFGYVLSVRPDALATFVRAVDQQLPGLAGRLRIQDLAAARTSAGLIGLLGLLYAGLGVVDALRGALQEMCVSCEPPVNWFVGKLRDLVALLLIGLTLVVSVVVGGFAVQATGTIAGWLGFGESVVATALVRTAGVLISVLADMLVFLVILGWMARVGQPVLITLKGALLGAAGFGVLKQAATLLLGHTLGNPIYGAFAVIVGLLVWLNLSTRWALYVAAWTATSGGAPPPEPTPAPASEYR